MSLEEENMISISRLVGASIHLSERAGQVIRSVLSQGLSIESKGDDGPVTQADRISQKLITTSLLRVYPNLKIIGEEDEDTLPKCMKSAIEGWTFPTIHDFEASTPPLLLQNTDKKSVDKLVIWVDPLDGTKEYVKGYPECVTTLIGISYDGKPIAGIIHHPFHSITTSDGISPSSSTTTSLSRGGQTLWGVVGVGYGGFTAPSPPQQHILTTSRSRRSKILESSMEFIQPSKVIRIGGAGSKIALLLNSVADAYIYPESGTNKWDICAGDAILTSCGGKLTDCNGESYNYSETTDLKNMTGLVATMAPPGSSPSNDHSFYISALQKVMTDKEYKRHEDRTDEE